MREREERERREREERERAVSPEQPNPKRLMLH